MSLLLDTHALIWWLANQPVSDEAHERIAEPSTRVVVSVASIWEAVIKSSAGELNLPEPLAPAAVAEGFELLPISAAHAEQVGELTLHHRDPFDRMLIAQAQVEGLTVVTRDRVFDLYSVPVLRC
jgi:PIN domain nuclease of toxin-antitoxin system